MGTVGESTRLIKKFFLFVLACAFIFSGCTGSKPPITITLSPGGTQNAIAGAVVNISAQVTNDSKTAGVTWTINPPSGAGALSAQTTTSVTYTAPSPIPSNTTATITATSVSDTTKSQSLTINLQAVTIALTPSATQTLEQTQTVNVSAAISNDPSTTPSVTWSLNAGAKGTLSGQTPTGVKYNAPASVTAASADTITAKSVFDNTKMQTLTINLVPPPSITTTTLPFGTVSSAYTATTLLVSGGVAPYTWAVTSAAGTFPAGLTLSTAGVISGTPTAYGTFNFTVQVKDANNFTANANLSIKVNPAPVTITTTSLPNGFVNMAPAYSATLTSTGGATPITWSWAAQSGSTLPPGLILATTGSISGTPTAAGTFNVTVTATDSSTPALTALKNFSITIIPQLVITTTSPLPGGITNTAYSTTLASTGGSGAVVWSLSGGTTLPANLSLNASTGAITGTPTTAGTFNFTVQAADSGTPQQKVTKAFAITIIQQLVISTAAALPTGSVTTPYSVTMASSGGTGAVTWAVASGSTLPGGLTLTAAGLLSGTPTTANTYNFSITATDTGTPPQTATKAFTLTITPKLAITTTQAQIPSGQASVAYPATTVMSNGGGIAPIAWSWAAQAGSSTPPGLSINSSSGVISGTPTTAGTFNVTVTVTDSGTPAQTASANFTISIATGPLAVATTTLPNGVVGQAYNTTLTSSGGNPPVTWSISVGSLPPGLNLASTGAITGTPTTTTGSPFNFTVMATDSSTPTHQTATKALSITVVGALSITTTQSQIPGGTVGSAYSVTIAATGGTVPYTWSWAPQAGSTLPPGLSINSSNGVISGTAGGTGGTFNVTVTVTDATSPQQSATANFSITITVATLVVTTTSPLPAGTLNTAYPNTQLNASGGIPPYTWALATGSGPLPTGLSLSAAGLVSGTPTASGTFSFTAQVTDSQTPAHTATAALSITVTTGPAIVATAAPQVFAGDPAIAIPITVTNDAAGDVVTSTLTVDANTGLACTTATCGSFNGSLSTTATGTSGSGSYSVTYTPPPATGFTTQTFPTLITHSSLNPSTPNRFDATDFIEVDPKGARLVSIGGLPAHIVAGSAARTVTVTVLNDATAPNGVVLSAVTASGYACSNTAAAINLCGTISAPVGPVVSGTTSTTTFTYTPPPLFVGATTPPPPYDRPRVQANSVGDNTQLAIRPFTVSNNPAPANTGLTIPPGSKFNSALAMPGAAPLTIVANIGNDTGSSRTVTWTLKDTGGANCSPGCGTLASQMDTGDGTFVSSQINYTPPSSVPTVAAELTPTITATSVDANTQTDSFTFTIVDGSCGTGHESLLNGPYAFLIRGGGHTAGYTAVIGSFTTNGTGGISVGQWDFNQSVEPFTGQAITSAGSSYTVGTDNRVCLVLADAVGDVLHFRGSVGTLAGTPSVATQGQLVLFNDNNGRRARASGVLMKQDSTSFAINKFSGSYAFGEEGVDSNGGRFSGAGVVTSDGAGHVTNLIGDFDDAGVVSGAVTGGSGTYGAPNANGRTAVTTTLTVLGNTSTTNLVAYLVSANEALMMTTDSIVAGKTIFSGELKKQTGPFTGTTLDNSDFVVYLRGIGSMGGNAATIVQLTFATSGGNFTATLDDNDSGTLSSKTNQAINLGIASTGRATITGAGAGGHPPIIYLIDSSSAFLVGTSGAVESGFSEKQVGGPFTDASLSGLFFFLGSAMHNGSQYDVGTATFDGAGNITGSGNHSGPNGFGTDTISPATGGTYSFSGTSVPVGKGTVGTNSIAYVISGSKLIFMSTKSDAEIVVVQK